MLAALAALALVVDTAVAQECAGLRQRMANGDPIILGVNSATRPFSYFEDGRGTGYMVDLCKRALARSAVVQGLPAPRYSYKKVDGIKAQFDALGSREIDLACTPTTQTVARRREKNVAFSLTVFLTGAAFLSRVEEIVSELPDLRGGIVTAVENTTTYKGLKAAIAARNISGSIELRRVRSHAEGIRELTAGDTRAHVGDQAILLPYLAANPGLRLGNKLNSFEPYAIALRRCDNEGLDMLDLGLSWLFRSGNIWEVYNAHFPGRKPGALLIATFIIGGLPE